MVQSRITHYEDGDVKVEGEVVGDKYFIHCQVHRYSHNIQKRIDLIFEEMKSAMREARYPDKIYACLENKSFAEYMGGVLLKELQYKGKNLGVYSWDLQMQ